MDSVRLGAPIGPVTERATIGSSILPLCSCTPMLLAMTALGVHKLSQGRCVLGLGASGPQVVEGFHGVPYDAPLARTREIIAICRMVWRGDKVQYQGDRYEVPLPAARGTGMGKALRIRDRALPAQIPIYVAALGPKNVALTAEPADGWLPLHYWPEHADVWADARRVGEARRSPELAPLQVVAGGPLCITEDYRDRRERSRAELAFSFGGMGARAQNFYNNLLRGTASSRRPRRSRRRGSTVGRRTRPRWCPLLSSTGRRSSARRAGSVNGSRRSGRRASPS
jgi:F420-dependent oxidoreductase-like protein